jgi:putative SOS response-associated peptidase YedK
MCGRFALDQELDDLIREFVVSENRFPAWQPNWNIPPTSTIPIVIERTQGTREIGPARWSLTPSWSQELVLPYPTFNARSETAWSKPTFRDSVTKHRCVIPARGYFEWVSDRGTKTPHFISRTDNAIFGFAGLYSWWRNPESGESVASATILTKESTGLLRSVHDRMPVLVPPVHYSSWLDPQNLKGTDLIHEMASATDSLVPEFGHYPVNPLQGNGPQLLDHTGKETL